jgi:Undecaprenyl-phosphate galactose phosphotransferase WbaP
MQNLVYSPAGQGALDLRLPRAARKFEPVTDVGHFALALLALVFVLPLMVVVALAIYVQDGGPVVFAHKRVGRGGRPFYCLKFRSMAKDAEARLSELLANDAEARAEWAKDHKLKNDPRITPLGRFLRKSSLDELPQLFNVLRGEMSLVGPRPPLPGEVEQYERDVHRRLLVRPGMTGLWQVSGRSDLSWSESVRLDLYYVDNWSLVSDVVIMLKTIRAVVASAGAY